MALITARFNSSVLYKQVELFAIVPEGPGPFPVCYLLHGGGDDASCWTRYSRVEDVANRLPLIVVMPDCYYSFSVDHQEGSAYGQYLVKDVIGFVDRTFDTIPTRAGRCVGGLSMGGYGALHLGLSHPELFASIHSTAGCFGFWGKHLEQWGMGLPPDYAAMLKRIHGTQGDGSQYDLFTLAKKVAGTKPLPALRLDCGTTDSLLQTNRDFHAHVTALGIPHEYHEAPGTHNWAYFDAQIGPALEFHCRTVRRDM